MLHVVVAAVAAAVYLHLLSAYSGYCLSATAVAMNVQCCYNKVN